MACLMCAAVPPSEMGHSTVSGPMIPSPWGVHVQDKRHRAVRIYRGHVASAAYSDYGPWKDPAVVLCPNRSNSGCHRRPVGEAAPMAPVVLAGVVEVHWGLAHVPRADVNASGDQGTALRAPGAVSAAIIF